MYIANVSDDGTPVAVSHDGFHLQDQNNPNRVMRDRQRMIEALQGNCVSFE